MRSLFWRLVHRWLPCKAIHALCSLCRDEGLCPRCIERKFIEWGGHALPPEECPCGPLARPPFTLTTSNVNTGLTFSTGTTYYWREFP